MQRILKIVLIITFMLLLILWFSTIFNTCNKKKNAEEDVASENLIESTDSTDVFEDLGDEFFEDDLMDNSEDDPFADDYADQATEPATQNTPSEPEADLTDYMDDSPSTPSSSNSTSSSSGSSSSTQSSGVENAAYLVVGGSFLVKDNADRLMNKLVNMGFDAEVRNFDLSQYHSVIVGRYNSRSSAERRASELKSKGVDCYVQRRRN